MKNLLKEYKILLNINEMPPFLIKYLDTPSLTRLKKITYFCGMDYASKNIYNFKEQITRYDHSLTTALLIYKLTQNKTMTLAGLFHDISTPCFSHVIDYMNNDYENQETTEEYTKEILESDKYLQKLLQEDNITIEEISNFKNYPVVDNERPKLCADRLDGIILNSISWTKKITKKDIEEILNNITIYKNEENEDEIGFTNKITTSKILNLNKEIDKKCHSKEDNYMMNLLAHITKLLIKNNIITYKQLYYDTEENILKQAKASSNQEIKNHLTKFKTISKQQIKIQNINNIKQRTISPLVRNIRINK